MKGKTNNPNGRPKGSKNIITRTAKENIADVFDMIGGLKEMAVWAKENRTAFYTHYAKLIPTELSGDPDSPLQITLTKVIKNARD